MAFIETRFLDNYIALGSSSGPMYQTEVTELSSGEEQRNQAWEYPRHRYLVGISAGSSDKIDTLRQLIHSTRGRFNGFRFKDFNDFTSAATIEGTAAFDDQDSGAGDAVSLTYQMFKNYDAGAATIARQITKLVSGTFLTGFTGTGWTQQDTGSRWTVDVDTGIITYDADIQKTITDASDQGGGVTRVVSVGHGLGLAASGTIHLSNFAGGSDWAGLNGRRVDTLSSTTANNIEFNFDSSTYAAYSGDGGQLNTIPQVAENVVWGGEFDVPVRFAQDQVMIEKITPGLERATIELIEIK